MLAKNISSIEDHKTVLTVVGYDESKYNALKHGVLSKYTVMQWENREDYEALMNSLINEYTPKGVTEEHLVEELAGIIWRKMRLRYAEMTTIQSSLNSYIERDSNFRDNVSAKDALLAESYEVKSFDIRQAVLSTEEENQEELIQIKEYLNYCLESEQILLKSGSYEDGLCALHEDNQNNWTDEWLNDDENDISSATAEDLLSWVDDLKKHYEKLIYELENRDKVKKQLLGKAFLSDKELNKHVRYENHLDKKFEKTLSILIKLKDLRETSILVEG